MSIFMFPALILNSFHAIREINVAWRCFSRVKKYSKAAPE